MPGCLGGSYVKVSRKLTIWEGLLVNSVHVSATDWGSNSLAAENNNNHNHNHNDNDNDNNNDNLQTVTQRCSKHLRSCTLLEQEGCCID